VPFGAILAGVSGLPAHFQNMERSYMSVITLFVIGIVGIAGLACAVR